MFFSKIKAIYSSIQCWNFNPGIENQGPPQYYTDGVRGSYFWDKPMWLSSFSRCDDCNSLSLERHPVGSGTSLNTLTLHQLTGFSERPVSQVLVFKHSQSCIHDVHVLLHHRPRVFLILSSKILCQKRSVTVEGSSSSSWTWPWATRGPKKTKNYFTSSDPHHDISKQPR